MSYEATLERISSIQARFAMAQAVTAPAAEATSLRNAPATGTDTSSLASLASALGMDTSSTSLDSLSTRLGSDTSRSSLFAQALDAATAPAAPASTGDSTGGTKDTGGTGGADIVATAKKYLGVPYVWGGTNPAKGLDCSGLVQQVLGELGVDMPRVARDQAKEGTAVASLADAKPGDLLGMRNGSHIAIYLGDNKILHAPQPGQSVSIRSLTSADDIDTIRRVVPAAA
jgi:cell wall-associated NlpC family hydrolase